MRIGIDVTPALEPHSGMRRYVELLLGALARIDAENEYFMYAAFWRGCPGRLGGLNLPAAGNFHMETWRVPQRLALPAEHFLGLALHERRLKPLRLDLFHGAGNILPRLRRLRSVVTIHHLGGNPGSDSRWRRFYFGAQTVRSLRAADRVIAISEATRREVIGAGAPPGRVTRVYYGGADPVFSPGAPGAPPPGVRGRYILFVSSIQERKNLGVLARAFALWKKREESRGFQLVFAGTKGPYFRALLGLCRELGLEGDVLFLDGATQDQLVGLYRGAELLAYPSKLEGFGLPVLEAMACGIPVVAADVSSLPEIAGEAGVLAPPDSPEAFADAFSRVVKDAGLRKDLARKGLERARRFSWETAARETLEVYRQALS